MGRPELAAFEPLLPAERLIVAELRHGDFDRLGDGSRPSEPRDERVVRAEFLRFLLLGGAGETRPHEKGVRVSGAWIEGVLDLEGCRVPRDIGLKDCRFTAVPLLRSAIIDNLFLDGSVLPGLDADRLEARGGLTLRGAEVAGTVRLETARIGGLVEIDGAVLAEPDGLVLAGRGLRAEGLTLRGAQCKGGIDLKNARLETGVEAQGLTLESRSGAALDGDSLEAGGNIVLRRATVSGEIRLPGLAARGDLDISGASIVHGGATALDLERAVVEGGFLLREATRIEGVLDLTGARLGTLHDTYEAWPERGDLLLNRCIYGAIIDGPVDAAGRLAWLARQDPARWGEDFWPQPYEQLAAVFREMGHDEDARRVLVKKERLQRRARRARAGSPLWQGLLVAKDGLLRVTVGYGRQPLLAFLWLAVFWLAGVAVFANAERAGAMKPNSAVILRSPEWTGCSLQRGVNQPIPGSDTPVQGRALPGQSQLDCYRSQFEALSYPELNVWMYSLDTLFPVLELGQRSYWRPDTLQAWGRFTIGYYYFELIVGWALSLLAVAGFSGLVRSNGR
ncbi:MAG: hypothetical protein U1E62_00460 [Alsobacter sp.]